MQTCSTKAMRFQLPQAKNKQRNLVKHTLLPTRFCLVLLQNPKATILQLRTGTPSFQGLQACSQSTCLGLLENWWIGELGVTKTHRSEHTPVKKPQVRRGTCFRSTNPPHTIDQEGALLGQNVEPGRWTCCCRSCWRSPVKLEPASARFQ